MQVRELMTDAGFFSLNPDADLVQAAQSMKRHNVGCLPITDDGRLLGIITDRDICVEGVAAGCDPHQCRVRDYMTAEPITIGPDASLEEAADLMMRHQIRRLPVTDRGRLLGMVSVGDLANNLTDDHTVANLIRRVSSPVRTRAAATQTRGERPGSFAA